MKKTVVDERSLPDYLAQVTQHTELRIGSATPFGAHEFQDGVNFAFASRNATRVRLELFARAEDAVAARVIDLDPTINRTGDVWHVWVKGICAGQLYAYRVDGPYDPMQGQRYNFNKLLLDPYAKALTVVPEWDFIQAKGYDIFAAEPDLVASSNDNAAATPKCIFICDQFDWQGDHPLKYTWAQTIIYETHIRGFSIHPSSGVRHPGTYRGFIEKIPYLKSLGITAVELMPIQEFNTDEPLGKNPLNGEKLCNYWGYNPVLFFAVKAAYSSSGGMGQQTLEFKEMVLALHQAGIEVILDLVFNHTAERDQFGPTFCYKGVDNSIFYMLGPDKQSYLDFTGVDNTINANHPIVQDLILRSLRYWVMDMHIDGFRFDEATVFDRSDTGELLLRAPLVERIAEDPILRDVKIIAEPWDASGLSKVGTFSQQKHWASWNSYYRDDVRSFWRGDAGKLGVFASRLCGSADIYADAHKLPRNSINYVTCHDGFTLNDLVSYAQKHNTANGKDGIDDGPDENFSANYGIEGDTNDATIEAIRKQQIKNFIMTLFISRGVPMLLGGDEFRRTQLGNNNAFCQDNEISWYAWGFLEKHQEIFRFVQGMIALRTAHPVLSGEHFYTTDEVQWFNRDGQPPDWNNSEAKQLAFSIKENSHSLIYIMFNAETTADNFILPTLAESWRWYLAVNTAATSPGDLFHPGAERLLGAISNYPLEARSSVILFARLSA